jgi:MFS family permease
MALPLWLPPLAAVVLMQIVGAFQFQAIWVLGPVLTAAAGVSPERIGELSGLVSLGSAWFFLSGTPILQRMGSLRTLQLGALLGSASLMIFFFPWWPVLMLASLIIGFGYGPTTPAASDVLARYTPPRHKSAMFSIKQAGAPLGGAVAGILLPSLAAFAGWQAAMVATALLGVAALILVQGVRRELDADRDVTVTLSIRALVSPANLALPFRAVAMTPRLPLLTLASFCLAAIQGNLFTFAVTYLTDEVGLTLVQAGAASSAMLVAGMVGRVAMGWTADRLGSAIVVIRTLAVTATLAILAVSAVGRDWSYPAIVAVFACAGFFATTWNGVFLAEVARIAPKGQIGTATAGSAFITFIAYFSGPFIFGKTVSAVGANGPVFASLAMLGLVAAGALVFAARRPESLD